jgi:hypothetical protein
VVRRWYLVGAVGIAITVTGFVLGVFFLTHGALLWAMIVSAPSILIGVTLYQAAYRGALRDSAGNVEQERSGKIDRP